MSQYDRIIRATSFLIALSLLVAACLFSFGSDISTTSLKTTAIERWNQGLSVLKIPTPDEHHVELSSENLRKLINEILDAKIAESINRSGPPNPNELKKRQSANPSGILGGLTGLTPASAQSAGGALAGVLQGAIGQLLANGSAVGILAPAAGALGEGVAVGAVDGLKFPKKAGVVPKQQDGINSITESLGQGLASNLTSLIDFSSLFAGLPTASRTLAVGLANGTATGLGLTQLDLAPTGRDPSLLSGAAGNLGFGLTDTLFPFIDLKQFTAPLLAQLPLAIVPAADGLGTGIAYGLKLNAPTAPPPALQIDPNNFQTPAAAHDFAFTFSSSLLKAVDTSAFLNPQTLEVIKQQVIQALPGIGTGLGSGASAGLGLSKATAAQVNPPVTDLNSGAQDFAFNLTSSFLGSIDISKLSSIAGGLNIMPGSIAKAAEGLGKGLGEGAAIGIGFRKDVLMEPTNSTDISVITETFSRNLVVSFLANGTLQTIITDLKALSSVLGNIQISKVTEGLGRGIVDGAEVTLGIPAPNDTFQDSVGGAALGFGKGLGESGVSLVIGIISGGGSALSGNSSTTPPKLPALGMPASPKPNPAPAAAPVPASPVPNPAPAPSAGTPSPASNGPTRSVNITVPLANPPGQTIPAPPMRHQDTLFRRQSEPNTTAVGGFENGIETGNFTAMAERIISSLNVTSTSAQLQKISNALTCVGFGGITAINKGLQNSKTVKFDLLKSKANVFGNKTFTVVGERQNVFTLTPGEGRIAVNGVLLSTATKLIAVHIVAATIAFFNIFPIVLMLAGVDEIKGMIGRPQIWPNSPRWQFLLQIIGFIPITIVMIGTGVAVLGHGKHVNTPHKAMGFVLAILGFVWVVTHRFMFLNPKPTKPLKITHTIIVGLMLFLTIVVGLTGFNDLATISNCLTQSISIDVFIGLGMATVATLANALGVLGLVFFIGRWTRVHNDRKLESVVLKNGKGSVYELRKPERIPSRPRRPSFPFLKRDKSSYDGRQNSAYEKNAENVRSSPYENHPAYNKNSEYGNRV